nr:keratin, type I cytoskeletal 9-like [Tanacetum cinerariifolium]
MSYKESKSSGSSEPKHYATCGIAIVEPKNNTVSYRGSGAEKGTYETKSYARFNDKQTGSYGRATVTEKASSGDFHWKNGTSGTRNEYKQTETVRYGDKSGYTEVYNERRVRDVSYENNYGGKNVVSYDSGNSGAKNGYGGGSGGGYGGSYHGGYGGDVVESFRQDMGGDVVSGSVSDSVSQGVGSHVMVNGFAESGMGNGILNGVRVHDVNGMRVRGVNESTVVNDVRANGSVGVTGGFGSSLRQAVRVRNVSELVSQGIVNAVGTSNVTETVMVDTARDNNVSGVRINGVNESVIVNHVRAMSNDVRTNSGVGVTGASGSVSHGMGNGVRTNGGVGVTDGFGSSLGQALVDHTGQVDKDCLLGWFNQEVIEDLGWLREYRSVPRGLKAVVRRRREHVKKGTRELLMMKEMEVKIGEKARFILNLRRLVVE